MRAAVSPLLAPVNVDVVFEHVYLVEGRSGHYLIFYSVHFSQSVISIKNAFTQLRFASAIFDGFLGPLH